jgi:alkylhydroperoxidase family enzyme
LPPAVRAGLEAHYDAGEIAEILCAIGALNYLNRVSNALQTQIIH